MENPQSDHDFTPGGSLPPFYQKTLETRSREDLLNQRLQEINRRIEELHHTPPAYGEDICTDPPFSQMIMQELVVIQVVCPRPRRSRLRPRSIIHEGFMVALGLVGP